MPLPLFISTCQKLAFSGLLLLSGYPGFGLDTTEPVNNDPKAASTNSVERSSIKGIDVSRWQKEVDWSLVRETDVAFAFIKASQGEFRIDPYFARNWEETKRHGIKRGAYHYFKPEAPALCQVELFKSIVTLEPGDLPPVLDVEVVEPGMKGEELRRNIKVWLEEITAHYGVKPIIYTSQNYYRRWLQGHFQEYHFWIARYSDNKPELHQADSWMFWQHTDRGRVTGINAAVDMNFFMGDLETLNQLCLPEIVAQKEQVSPLSQLKHMYPLP
ncbi:lysozyme [Pontibacter ummariensis]|uniref:Lysozyme n=1 Tax=Pontibacter ummariensis TaxID=1610492 RepID=A0A239CGG9_9BACT|nr:GH25 family lysozyme [Pontibacter ummariensis]PRY15048.1 lysozyme [Pontibacter ummariensis]SNS18791.1 lysozyme [Pontibacter ummariensis]